MPPRPDALPLAKKEEVKQFENAEQALSEQLGNKLNKAAVGCTQFVNNFKRCFDHNNKQNVIDTCQYYIDGARRKCVA